MQAIEFLADSRNGIIRIPECYREWHAAPVKVILLRDASSACRADDEQRGALHRFFAQFNADLTNYHFNREDAHAR